MGDVFLRIGWKTPCGGKKGGRTSGGGGKKKKKNDEVTQRNTEGKQ